MQKSLMAALAASLSLVTAHAQPRALWLHPKAREMAGQRMGPFVRVSDVRILTIDGGDAFISGDQGKTWSERHAIFEAGGKYEIRPERALLRTRAGTIILAFTNDRERANWNWDAATSDSPGARLPTYAVRSTDGGRTWEAPVRLHEDWTGAIRDIIQTRSGKVVFTSMKMLHNPGRHSVLTYVSSDDGKSWRASNLIDLGGVGHHGGVSEPTVEEIRDGRLWMLIRTNWSRFWEAFSDDGGLSWRTIRPSRIEASSAPGLLKRLQSGRLILIWNRLYPEGKTEWPLRGGDNQWSEVPVSNHREELAVALSQDDGASWSDPIVLARRGGDSLSYPYLFEARPGEIWITTMQGDVRITINEADLLRK